MPEIKRTLFVAPYRQEVLGNGRKTKTSLAPPLGLLTIAGYTPPGMEVSLVDENISPIDFDKSVSLVAITATTPTVTRAYEIADEFRRRKIPVVLGGIHPTVLPDEAGLHADAVVVGEAENVWAKLLYDLQRNDLQQIYQSTEYHSMENLPHPRRDLFQPGSYVFPNTIQTTRGCPNDCNFCSVTSFFGGTYRSRPIEEVLAEVDTLPSGLIFFVDDNIAAHRGRAKQLFQGLAERKKQWIGQASVSIGHKNNGDLLKSAADSGCLALFLGIESLSPASLAAANKGFNVVGKYKDQIQRIHDHGISIFGAFIFGLDGDGSDVFEKTVRFAEDTRLECAQFNNLIPYPGTPLHKEKADQHRIITRDWSQYHADQVVCKPKLMSVEELYEGRNWAEREFFSLGSILKRIGLSHTDRNVWMALNANYRRDRFSRWLFDEILLPRAKKAF